MNFRFVFQQLGFLWGGLALVMGMAGLATRLFWHEGGAASEKALEALGIAIGASLLVAAGFWAAGRGAERRFARREALLLVALTWVLGAVQAALPFWIWAKLSPGEAHVFAGAGASYFEAMSGITTTGATVLGEIDALPRVLLLWRAVTHWLGGLGIVVLFVAVLPGVGAGGKKLYQAEMSASPVRGLRPRIAETARVLWMIYCGITLAQIGLLKIAGLSWFDAITHTFATVSTGGFSPENASVGGFHSAAVHGVIIVFMVLAGVNFALYDRLWQGRWREVLRDPELRLYLGVIVALTLLVSGGLYGGRLVLTDGSVIAASSLGEALQHGLFQVVSIVTGTGFATADFDQWPFAVKFLLVLFMFSGACTGSTCGGIKLIRLLVAGKVMLAEVERFFRPQVIKPVRVGRKALDPAMKVATLSYVLAIIGLTVLATLGLILIEPAGTLNITTAFTASAATLNNVGPGLAGVGAVEHYGGFSPASLAILSLLMALGRLEIFAILVLFVPRFWQGE